MNGKFFKISGVVVVLAVVAVIILALLRHAGQDRGVTITAVQAVPGGFATSVSYSDTSMVFSNGRAFVDYDYSSGQSRLLSPDEVSSGLANIDSLSLSSDKQYLLFHDEQAGAGVLLDTLRQQKLDTNQDYWWIYHIAQQTFQPIPHAVLLAKLNGNQVDTLAAGSGSESITAYSLADLRQIRSINIPGSSDFLPYQNGFLLESPTSDILYTEDGVVSRILYRDMTLVGVDTATQQGIGVEGQGSMERQLAVLDLMHHSASVIARNIVGQPVWSAAGAVLYSTQPANSSTPPAFAVYDLAAHRIKPWVIKAPLSASDQATLVPVSLLGATTAVAAANQNSNYLVGIRLAGLKPADAAYNRSIHTSGRNVVLQYAADQNAFVVPGIVPGLASAVQAAVYSQLKADGYNPNLVTLRFTILPG